MKRHYSTYLLVFTVGSAGCIVTKDMANDDGADSGSSSETAETGGDANGEDDGNDSATTGASASGTSMGSASASAGDDLPTATSEEGGDDLPTATSPGDGDTLGDDGSTGTTDEEELCANSEGTWEPTACGHYDCGVPNECEAVIPGCDCGYLMNWVDGFGCIEDDACLEASFGCGDTDCSVALEYCEIFHPGPSDGGGPTHTCLDLPTECLADHTCECLSDEASGGECELAFGGGITIEIFAA